MENNDFLIIAGTYKSGTSSLFTYLNQLSFFNGSKIKETGFFVPIRYKQNLKSQEHYLNYFDTNNEGIKLEASPGYLYGGESIAKGINNYLNKDVKYIFILREPTDRLISFYKMLNNGLINDYPNQFVDKQTSLKDYINICTSIEQKNENEKIEYVLNGVDDGMYNKYLSQWYSCMDSSNIKIIFFDDIEKNPRNVCENILEWLNLDANELDKIDFRIVNQSKKHKNETLRKFSKYVNRKFEKFWRKNDKLKSKIVSLYAMVNTKKSDNQNIFENEMQQLNDLYREDLRNLKKLLLSKQYNNLPNWLEKLD